MAYNIISNYLSKYFLNLNTKTLSLSFWSGYLNCENLKLNPQSFNENKNLPIHLQDGFISKINMSLPTKSFFLGINNDIEISIEDLDISLITNSEFEFFDYTNFDYKNAFIKEITDDLLFKMQLSKNPNLNDTYLRRSIDYFLRNMKITIKNLHVKLIHGVNELFSNIFCANIDKINLKNDSIIIDNFYVYTENIISSSSHNIRKKEHDYILLPISIKSKIKLVKKSEIEINNKENINTNTNTSTNLNLNNNNINNNEQNIINNINSNNEFIDIETYYVEFNISEININIHKEQFKSIMNIINFFIDYYKFYNNCFILRKIQYKKPKKEDFFKKDENENQKGNENTKEKNNNYYSHLLRHYIIGIIKVIKEKNYNIDVFDYYKDLNTERKKIFQNKFIDYFFKNKKDDEIIDIIRFTDELILKKWIEEMCDNIYKYQKESAEGFFSGLKSFFFSSAIEAMEMHNIEEVSSKQKIIWELKGHINIITLSLRNFNEEIKLSLLENEIDYYRGRVNNCLEMWIGSIKLTFKHLINKSIFCKEIILPLTNNYNNDLDESKEIYIKYIFKNFIPKLSSEKSFLNINCTSHVFIYNPSMFHSLYEFLYKDVTFMNKKFNHYKLFLKISKHKFDNENKVNLDINIANHKIIFPYIIPENTSYNNEEKLEINMGDVYIKSSEQYDVVVKNISMDFKDKNLATYPIIKNFNLELKSSFDLNTNTLKLKNIEIQASLHLLQTLLYNSKNFSALTKPEEIWKIKTKNKNQIFENSIKRGFLYFKNKENKWMKYYALLSQGYIYLFENNEKLNPDILIPLFDSNIEEVYFNNNIENLNYGINIIYGDKNVNEKLEKYEIIFNDKKLMIEWKNSINSRIEEINQTLINFKIRKKRKLSDPNNIINKNINLNEKKKSNKNIIIYGNNYCKTILEESNRIRKYITNKNEKNQLKKLRMFAEQFIKFVHLCKGNRQCLIEIDNISLFLSYSDKKNNINHNKGCKINIINTKIEYIENNIFFIIKSYFGNIQIISNNLNLIKVYKQEKEQSNSNDNIIIDEILDKEENSFLNCNLLVCFENIYYLIDKNRDELLKLIPNINKKEEIEDFILKIKTNQIKVNIFKELDIFFEPEEIFINIKLIKNFFKRIKKKVDETIQIKNKMNLIINTEKNISLIYYDELNKSNYYLILKKIKSKENSTILKDVHLIYVEKENKRKKEQNKKIIIKEFDVIIKDSFNNNIIMYDAEFSSEVNISLNKVDFDNLYNIINDIRYSLKNNFAKNINQMQNNNDLNNLANFQSLFTIKIQKFECNFTIASIFRLKNDNEIKLTLNNIIINKEKLNNYTYLIEDITLIRYVKNNGISNKINNNDSKEEILIKIPKSYNAIYLQYENIKNDKKKLIDLVIDKIIFNFQYELLYDFLNFFINVKYNNLNYHNNKEIINNNIEVNSIIPNNTVNSSFSNNTILSFNTFNKENNNSSDIKNSKSNENQKDSSNKKDNKIENNSELTSDFVSFQLVPRLFINLNINSLLIKIPTKQQNNNINLINNDINDKINNKKQSFDKSEEEIYSEDKASYFCIELISVLIKYFTDLIGNDKSLPCNKYLRIQSPENKIFMINEENNIVNKNAKFCIKHILNKSFSFFTEIKYNYKIHKEIFVPQKTYSFYYIIPDDIILYLTFEQVKNIMDIIIDIKNYFHESKLTYFTYCYLSEPEIFTTLKTLFLEICGHIQQKIIIRLEEFFEIIIKKVHFNYKDLSQEKYNQEINLIFTLVINYYNKKLKEYELFLEPYNFKFTALSNSFKFCSNDKLIIYKNQDNADLDNKENLNLNEIKAEDDIINTNNKISDKISPNNSNNEIDNKENIIIKDNNPYGLSLNITVELLYIVNNLYDIFMLYKKCHVLQNIQDINNMNNIVNNKSFIIYIYNYTNEIIRINNKYQIKAGELLKYKVYENNESKEEQLYEINFCDSNIQYNKIKLNQLQNELIYNKLYFYYDTNNKYYFYCPIIFESFCQKELYICNFIDKEKEIILKTNIKQGLDINNFKNKIIYIKLNENIIISLNEIFIETMKKQLNDKENSDKNKLILKDYFIIKFEYINKEKINAIKISIYPRYLILNTLDIPIIFFSILNKYPDTNNKMPETELYQDGKETDLYYPNLPQLKFKLKIIDNEAKNGNTEFLSDLGILNNEYFDEYLFLYNNSENNINNLIKKNDNNLIFNGNNIAFNYYDLKKMKPINGKLKIRFKDSEDLIIKIIYHTIPETKQIKLYLYIDYFILNNTILNIYPLKNCISFKDKNFMVNYYPLKNYKNLQLVVCDKLIDKFEIRKEDYAFFIHIEVEIVKDKKINLLIQRHLRYFKLGEKLYKVDFLIISQIQKLNINNQNNINNIILNSNRINKIKNISKSISTNNNIYSEDDILMKLVKQKNLVEMPEISNINQKFSFQINIPAIFLTLITNTNNQNNGDKNKEGDDNIKDNTRKEIASIYLDNIDFNYAQEKINFKKNNDGDIKQNENEIESSLIENNNIINTNININSSNSKNRNNNDSNNDIDINNYNNYLEEIEDIYNNNIELTIQSIQIDNLLGDLYKIIFYNIKENKKLLSQFNDSSFNYNNNYSSWLGIPLLSDKNNIGSNNSIKDSNHQNNNNLLPFIHFKGSFINQEYKYYFKEINICFLPCYLYLDSDFSSELLLFIIESYNIFKNKIFYYSLSIKEIIDSLSFNLDTNFNSKFIFISSFKISPLTIIFNYKNLNNRFFDLLFLQNSFINNLLDVFTNNTTSIKFQFNSISLYDINVRFMALIYKLYDYYYYTFLGECIKLIFSVDILGDPYHLLSHLNQGISNFITLPILNIFNGPSDFIFYLLYGTKSLLSNSIGGLLDSLHKFTNSMSKNILKLSNSQEYKKSRNKIMINENYLDANSIYCLGHNKNQNYNLSNGFNLLLIMKILVNGVKYGVKDLFEIPYKFYKNKGIFELPIGAIIGSMSLLIKPMSAVMDSISILSNSISHELLKGEKNFDIDEDYMYYTYDRKRQRRDNIYNPDNKEKIRKYKEKNIDILLKLVGDCINIDNEIELGIINGNNYYIEKMFITKYIINGHNNEISKKSNDIKFNIENDITDLVNPLNNKDNLNINENKIITKFTIIVFIKNKINKEYSILIYVVNFNKNKNERKFELFSNKKDSEKDFNISMKLQDIIPCKEITSVNYDRKREILTLSYQKQRKSENNKKGKIISILKYNSLGNFYGYLYLNKTIVNINISFSSKYILNEFLDYFNKLKYNIPIRYYSENI